MPKSYNRRQEREYIYGSLVVLVILINSCCATLDLSNLNFDNFQFFRYQKTLSNGEVQPLAPPPPSLGNHIQKAKAVGVFVQRLLFGYTGDDAQAIPIAFSPNIQHLREQFQRKYGYRGKHLIEQLGNGNFRYSSGYLPCSNCKV